MPSGKDIIEIEINENETIEDVKKRIIQLLNLKIKPDSLKFVEK
ncbi:MAG: hypothetical protein ACTSPY_11585 [Candidatus Helarchaeota archaeon]